MDEFRNSVQLFGRRALIYRIGLTVLALAFLLMPGRAFGASALWVGGCGEDPSWSCGANWKQGTPPGPGDVAVFNAKSTGTAVVDSGFGGEVAAIRLAAGFPGRVALDRSLNVSNAFQQNSGEFTAGAQALSVKTFNLFGGDFQASSGTMSVSGSLKVTGSPAFDANGGTLVIDGTGRSGGKLTCDGIAFNRVVFENTVGTKTVTPSCDLPLGADPVAGAGGSIKLEGTLSGTGALSTTGLLTLSPGGDVSGFSHLNASSLTIAGAYDFGGYSNLSVSGEFNLKAGGDFTAPAGTASFSGRFKVVPTSVFDANGGEVVFDGVSGSIACGEKSFNLVRFEQTGVRNVERDCSLPLGANPILGDGNGALVRLNGTLSGSGTLAVDRNLTLNRYGQLAGFGGLDVQGDLFVAAGVTGDFHTYAPFSIDGAYSQAAGKVAVPSGADFGGSFTLNLGASFDAPVGAATFGADFYVSPGATFDSNGGTVVFAGEQSAALSCGATKFASVVFSHTAGTKTVGSACSLPLGSSPTAGSGSIVLEGTLSGSGVLTASGTLSLAATGALSGFSGLAAQGLAVEGPYDFGGYSSLSVAKAFAIGAGGSFIAPKGTATFAGDFTDDGAFAANGGTIVLAGGNQTIAGSTTFYNLTKVAGAADTFTFATGSTQTVQGLLKLQGKGTGSLLKLVPSIPGSPWRIDKQGTAEVEFVSVTDSANVGTPIVATESKSEGSNSGWSISGAAVKFVLEAQTATPTAGVADNLTILAKDAYDNTAASYAGTHSLTFGPVADSPSGAHAAVTNFAGGGIKFDAPTQIAFVAGVAVVADGANGAMTLVKAGPASITVSDGSISNGSGLAVTVNAGTAARIAWTHATVSKGTLSSPCLFTCTGTEMSSMGNFKANVSITDSSGNTVSALGSGHTVSVTSASGAIAGGTLTIAASGQAESTTQFTYTSSKGGAVALTAATASGTVYTSATATMTR